MIDVWQVIFNALWILGLALLLATWSYARYAAYEAGVKTRVKFAELRYALALNVGLLLFIAGMAATENRWWARGLWIVLGIGMIVDSALRIRQARTPAPDPGAAPARTSGPGQAQVTPDLPDVSDVSQAQPSTEEVTDDDAV